MLLGNNGATKSEIYTSRFRSFTLGGYFRNCRPGREGRIDLVFPSLARAKVSVQVFASADAYDRALCVRVLDRAFEKYGNSSTLLCERDDNARFPSRHSRFLWKPLAARCLVTLSEEQRQCLYVTSLRFRPPHIEKAPRLSRFQFPVSPFFFHTDASIQAASKVTNFYLSLLIENCVTCFENLILCNTSDLSIFSCLKIFF